MTPIPLEDKEYKSCPNCCYDIKDSNGDIMEHECLETEQEVETHKWLHKINTFHSYKNEICLRGTDEDGKDITIWFDSYDFLKWIDKEQIEYIKEQLIKHIKTK